MLDESSNEGRSDSEPVFDLTIGQRLPMVVFGYIPFLHFTAVVTLLVAPLMSWTPMWLLGLIPVVLYLIPPLIVRLALMIRPIQEGRFSLGSTDFLFWWFIAQWQVIFNRLDILEELLRLIPTIYSLWLRLWGAKVGSLVYWAPGCRVFDRPLVQIGDRVVFGVGVRLHAHVISREGDGKSMLVVAPIRIENDVMLGGLSLLTAGNIVRRGEMTPACHALPPFAEWRHGKRVRHRMSLVR